MNSEVTKTSKGRPPKKKQMVWTCRDCNAATPMTENRCRKCGAAR